MNLLLSIFLIIEILLLAQCTIQKLLQIGPYQTDVKFYVDYDIPEGEHLWILMETSYEGLQMDSIKGIKQQIQTLKDFVKINNFQLTMRTINQSLNSNMTTKIEQTQSTGKVVDNFQIIFDKLSLQIIENVTIYQQFYVKVPSVKLIGQLVDKLLQLKQIRQLKFNIIGIQWLDQLIITPQIQQNLEKKYRLQALQLGKISAIDRCKALNMELAVVKSFQLIQFDDNGQKIESQVFQQVEGKKEQQSIEKKPVYSYEEALQSIIQSQSFLYQNRFYELHVICTGQKSPLRIKASPNKKGKQRSQKSPIKRITKGKQLQKQLKKYRSGKTGK